MLRGPLFCCAMMAATLCYASEKPTAADAIAQKFADQTPPAATTESQPAAPFVQRPKVQAAKSTSPKPAAAKPTVTARAERPSLDYEIEMLRQARAEQSTEKPATPAAPNAGKTETLPFAGAPIAAAAKMTHVEAPVAVTPVAPAPAVVPAAPVKTAETTTIPAAVPTPPAAAPAPAAAAPEVQAKAETKPIEKPAEAVQVAAPPAAHASLLLALETGGGASKTTSAPTYDPMICLNDTCFVSAGLNADAVKLSKIDALKLKTTSEASPDSCKGKVGCVFRNVAVPAGAQVQVVELSSANHETVGATAIQVDTTCKMTDGDLNCENPILTTDYRIWVVPEDAAKSAGVPAIEEAVADGLPHLDVARATDK
jgi:hypothetical protein